MDLSAALNRAGVAGRAAVDVFEFCPTLGFLRDLDYLWIHLTPFQRIWNWRRTFFFSTRHARVTATLFRFFQRAALSLRRALERSSLHRVFCFASLHFAPGVLMCIVNTALCLGVSIAIGGGLIFFFSSFITGWPKRTCRVRAHLEVLVRAHRDSGWSCLDKFLSSSGSFQVGPASFGGNLTCIMIPCRKKTRQDAFCRRTDAFQPLDVLIPYLACLIIAL